MDKMWENLIKTVKPLPKSDTYHEVISMPNNIVHDCYPQTYTTRPRNIPKFPKIDLHGQTINDAYNIVYDFIINCRINKIYKVLVITGKGNGESIRHEFPVWLRSSKFNKIVLRHEIASPALGGSGAFIVFLRK